MNFDEALQALPHGPEFRFVDEVIALEPGKSAVGQWRLRDEASFFKGHFPGQPILPAVLMVEAIAQLAGVAAQCDPVVGALPDLRLTAIRTVKVYGTAVPGDVAGALAEEISAVEADLGDHGRVLVRSSGTEPLVRVMVEAPSPEAAEAAADRLVSAVEALGVEGGHQ